ncbi:MAG: PIN domain-containing protein [Scytonema sp. PMC 1069.18]|nr:PIN domain-containing protein [Scytonema sp. PMC 1069.18]MEC4881541.1 PIN domain-containing protein [Scytonema sp. PMC 1070.18]
MSRKKTYIDSGVLITAFQGIQAVSIRANRILNDENRDFASSCFVQLEVLPKATFNKQQDEAEFYETFFSAVIHWATDLEQIMQDAYQIACTYGLAAMDSLHVAAALQVKADELITTEKSTKPMHRVTEIQIISI